MRYRSPPFLRPLQVASPTRHYCLYICECLVFWEQCDGWQQTFNAARPVRTEEFRKQGPCRFGRSAVVEDGITGCGRRVAQRRDVLAYRNTPAGPRMLQPWMACLTGSWSPLTGGRGFLAAARPAGPTRPPVRWRLQVPALRTRSAAEPGQPRACLTRPKSFIYHFAAEVL